MKQFCLLLLVITSTITIAFAQQPPSPEVKKGYYAIGDNASKLPRPTLETRQVPHPPVAKGYYSFGDHHKQLPKKTLLVIANTTNPAPKGYYTLPRKKS